MSAIAGHVMCERRGKQQVSSVACGELHEKPNAMGTISPTLGHPTTPNPCNTPPHSDPVLLLSAAGRVKRNKQLSLGQLTLGQGLYAKKASTQQTF